MDKRLIYPLLAVIAAGGIVFGVAGLGEWARSDLDRRDYFRLAIDEVECPTPPGMTREVFLAEVQFVGSLAAKMRKIDPGVGAELKTAFARHPWVESVQSVNLVDRPSVSVTFRRPTLVIGARVLDRNGVLLPASASVAGLPVVRGPDPAVRVESGQRWSDPAVVATTQVVAWLYDQAPEIVWTQVELTREGLILTRSDGAKATWGGAASDPPPTEKLDRLTAWKGGTIDLRRR